MSFSRSSVLPILRAGSSCWVAMSARFIELLPPARCFGVRISVVYRTSNVCRDHRRWNTYGCSLSTHRQNNHTLRFSGTLVYMLALSDLRVSFFRAHGDAVLTMFVDPDIFTRRTARERTSFCLVYSSQTFEIKLLCLMLCMFP